MHDVAVGFHTGKLAGEALIGLGPGPVQCRGAADAVALDLVRRQAGEVCVMAPSAPARLRDAYLPGHAAAVVGRSHAASRRDTRRPDALTSATRPATICVSGS